MEKVEVTAYNRVQKFEKTVRNKKLEINNSAMGQALIYGIAFMLGRAVLLNGIAPFGAAFFTAGLNKKNRISSFWTAVFSLLGCISASGFTVYLKYVIAICAIGIIEVVFDISSKNILLKSIAAAIISGLMFMLYTYFTGFLTYDIIVSAVEAVLVLVLTYIFSYFFEALDKKEKVFFSTEQIISMVITFSLVLVALQKIEIFNINIQNVIAMFFIMEAGCCFGGPEAAAGGAFLGLILNISNSIAPSAIGIWAFSGLFGGIMKRFKKLGVATGFIIGWILINGYTNFDEKIVYSLIDMLIGTIMFMVIPNEVPLNFINKLKPMPEVVISGDSAIASKIVEERLREFSGAIDVLSEQFADINNDESNKNENEKINILMDNVAQNVCVNCEGYEYCYKSDFYSTYRVLFNAIDNAKYKGGIDRSCISDKFAKKCIKLNAFIKELNYAYNNYRLNLIWERKLSETKNIMSKQLKEVAQTLESISLLASSKVEVQLQIKELIHSALSQKGIEHESLEVYKDSEGILNIEFIFKGCMGRLKCFNEIIPVIEDISGCKITKTRDKCMYDYHGEVCMLHLVQAPIYTMKFGTAGRAKILGGVCGDNSSSFLINTGKMGMILSDGMGTGIKAYNQSKASIESMVSLLKSGFQGEAAAKLVNSILFVGGAENSFATLDFCTINLYNGDIEFSKIGAAPSYIKRKNKVEYIMNDSLPVGILDTVDVKLSYKHLEEGDIVVMVSDGVLDNGDGLWLKRYLSETKLYNVQEIADEVISIAAQNCGENLNDDITVIVGRLDKI